MIRAALILAVAVGGLYFFRDELPPGWLGFDRGTAASAPGAFGKLGQSVGGAMKRSADRF